MGSLEADSIFPSLREVIIEDDSVPMTVYDDCRIHWLLILLILAFIIYCIIRVIINNRCVERLRRGDISESNIARRYHGDKLVAVTYLISVVISCFFWECDIDMVVTAVALFVALAGTLVLTCQDRRLFDVRPYEHLASSKA